MFVCLRQHLLANAAIQCGGFLCLTDCFFFSFSGLLLICTLPIFFSLAGKPENVTCSGDDCSHGLACNNRKRQTTTTTTTRTMTDDNDDNSDDENDDDNDADNNNATTTTTTA